MIYQQLLLQRLILSVIAGQVAAEEALPPGKRDACGSGSNSRMLEQLVALDTPEAAKRSTATITAPMDASVSSAIVPVKTYLWHHRKTQPYFAAAECLYACRERESCSPSGERLAPPLRLQSMTKLPSLSGRGCIRVLRVK